MFAKAIKCTLYLHMFLMHMHRLIQLKQLPLIMIVQT